MPDIRPFHLAFPVTDLVQARKFYTGLLGCAEGRSDPLWIDFNLYGHQIVAHLCADNDHSAPVRQHNPVDGERVPVPHFGVILDWDEWQGLAARLEAAGINFLISPGVRFKGKKGEQATMFFHDPFGNSLEFKAFRDEAEIFASD